MNAGIAGEKAWQRSFDPVTFGPQTGPNNDANFSGGRGSQNLAFYGSKVAIVAEDLIDPEERYHVTVLDAESGATEASAGVYSDIGNSRAYRFPWAIVSASGDNAPGLTRIYWDAPSGILFTSQGAYESGYTAYLPLEEAGLDDEFEPAYESVGGAQDAFGRTRAQHWNTVGSTANKVRSEGLRPEIWGLSATFCGLEADPDERPPRYDVDWAKLWGNQGASYYNTAGVISAQPTGPLIGLNKGAGWGHCQTGHFYLFNKYTGLKALAEKPEMPENAEGIMLQPFSSGGMYLTDDRMYLIGPSEDRNNNDSLGTSRPEGLIPNVDQGLAVWAYDITLEDRQPNDALTGDAALDTAQLNLAFKHELPSRYEETDEFKSYGQSWYETDGFYRPKPMVADGDGVWVSWKPSMADSVELVYAKPGALGTIDLGIGQGMKGVDLWPHLEMAETSQGRRLVYFTPNSRYRERVMPDDIDEFMAPFEVGRGNKVPYAEVNENERNRIHGRIKASGAWSPELSAPRGDAGIAVVDPESGKLLWNDNVSERLRYLPPNGFWTFIERSQMAVLGDTAVIAYVNNELGESTIDLFLYDLTADAPTGEGKRIPLGFDGADYPGSALTDLRVHDGKLYALVTQGEVFTLRDPRWTAQHVVAIR